MQEYRRVTHQDRCHIWAWLQDNNTKKEIARRLGFHPSTIYRELRRNCTTRGYSPDGAQRKYKIRYRKCRKPYKLRADLLNQVICLLKNDWSPEQISLRLSHECRVSISHECIYKYVRAQRSALLPHLRRLCRLRGGGRYKQRGGNPHKFTPNINTRPIAANQRLRIGDWERDIFFAGGKTPVLICVDRKSRFIQLKLVADLKAKTVNQATCDLLQGLGRKAFTMTNDRGAEFKVPLDEVKTYYCDPQTPQQRGTVENTIGLIRQYIKRNTDPKSLNEKIIKSIETKINLRPRKTLCGLTPFEVFHNKRVALAN